MRGGQLCMIWVLKNLNFLPSKWDTFDIKRARHNLAFKNPSEISD